MRLTPKQLRQIIKEELDNSPQLIKEDEIHWTITQNPKAKWIKVGNKWWVARPRGGGRTGVEVTWSSDGRRTAGMHFPIQDSSEQKAVIEWLSDLELDLPPEDVAAEEEIADITNENIPT